MNETMLSDSYIPKVTTAIVIINAIVFAVLSFMGNTEDAGFMMEHGAMTVQAIQNGQWYLMFTAVFLHFGFMHLANNMFVLFFTGRYVEQEVGPVVFFVIYILSGLFGNVCSYFWDLHQAGTTIVVSAGASGAIFGVIGLLFILVILKHGKLAQMSQSRMLLMLFLSIYQGYSMAGVNNLAHMGGLFAGIIMGLLFHFAKKIKYATKC